MSESQKKTLGIAVVSLVFGCFILIPILGVLFAIAAIVLGVIALSKINKNKETLKGKGLAISGIVLGGTGVILIPVIAMLAAIAIPNFLRAKMNANEINAKAALKKIVTASESYAAANDGEYPFSVHDLTAATPPYLTENYTFGAHEGYKFDCEFNPSNYKCVAIPENCNTTGAKIYTIEKGGELSAVDCKK